MVGRGYDLREPQTVPRYDQEGGPMRRPLQTEPQQCGKHPARSGKEVPISLSADGVGAAGAPRGGAGAFGSAV
jgi:hypothetical protein